MMDKDGSAMNRAWQVMDEQPVTALLAELSLLAARQASAKQNIPEILQLLADRTGLTKIRLLLHDNAGQLRIRYAVGMERAEMSQGSLASGGSITGLVWEKSRAECRQVEADNALFPPYSPPFTVPGMRAHGNIAVPIIVNGDCIGVLAAGTRDTMNSDQAQQILQITAIITGQLLSLKTHAENPESIAEHAGGHHLESPESRATFGILGHSPALQDALHKARRAATSHAPIMLYGETGTGKERFARMIHLASDRRDQPFVCINCATVPENLLESELLGHEKGSFTGATAMHIGKFELANGGTLFLDEIGEMSLSVQAKILRVLQEQVFQRVGGNQDIAINVRVITATNKNLENAVNVCTFRLDLYYRLNVIRIQLPALRDRGSDIRLLASYFLTRENQRYGRNLVLNREALDMLEQYQWPGNVRQLENMMTRVVIMSDRDTVTREQMAILLEEENTIGINGMAPTPGSVTPAAPVIPVRPYFRVDDQERERIEDALRLSRGNKTSAAQYLGLSVRQLHYRVRKLGIH